MSKTKKKKAGFAAAIFAIIDLVFLGVGPGFLKDGGKKWRGFPSSGIEVTIGGAVGYLVAWALPHLRKFFHIKEKQEKDKKTLAGRALRLCIAVCIVLSLGSNIPYNIAIVVLGIPLGLATASFSSGQTIATAIVYLCEKNHQSVKTLTQVSTTSLLSCIFLVLYSLLGDSGTASIPFEILGSLLSALAGALYGLRIAYLEPVTSAQAQKVRSIGSLVSGPIMIGMGIFSGLWPATISDALVGLFPLFLSGATLTGGTALVEVFASSAGMPSIVLTAIGSGLSPALAAVVGMLFFGQRVSGWQAAMLALTTVAVLALIRATTPREKATSDEVKQEAQTRLLKLRQRQLSKVQSLEQKHLKKALRLELAQLKKLRKVKQEELLGLYFAETQKLREELLDKHETDLQVLHLKTRRAQRRLETALAAPATTQPQPPNAANPPKQTGHSVHTVQRNSARRRKKGGRRH